MTLRSLRRRCERTLDALQLSPGADVAGLAERLAQVRGRRLHLEGRRMLDGPCGVWVALPKADYVFYEEQTNPLHREHIVLHELGHLAADHSPGSPLATDVALTLMPNLDAALVQRVLGRTSYSTTEEREAEVFASVFRVRHPFPRSLAVTFAAGGDVVARVGATLRGLELP